MKIISNKKLTDEDLVKEIVENNNSQLFGLLYDRYAHIVYNRCYGFAKSKEEAQDLTHDVFIKLFVKLRTFKGRSKFSTWLYSFTYNFCVNYVQRDSVKKQERNTVTTDIIRDDDINLEEIDDSSLLELKSEKLAKVLEIIDVNDKMILLMKYQDDMTIKEIAVLLSLGESAVKMRLKRAKERVIKTYDELT